MTFEELRETIMAAFQAAHDTSYPTTLVDYPNRPKVDVETQVNPWVRVELAINNQKQLCLGSDFTRVSGWLYIVTNVQTGEGTRWQTQYTDFLDTNFSLKTINEILFRELVPLPGVSYPAWHTVRNVLPFTFEKY